MDLVFSGHVHAFERSHPVYRYVWIVGLIDTASYTNVRNDLVPRARYNVDTCGPIHVVIGDGGNIEGPYRNFVDEVDPVTSM